MGYNRVLIGVDPDEHSDVIVKANLRTCLGWLEAMGYECDVQFIIEDSAWLRSFNQTDYGYDFIVWFKGTFGWTSSDAAKVILTGEAVIPTFIVGYSQAGGAGTTADLIGITRLATAGYKWLDHKNGFTYPGYTFEYEATAARLADLTPIVTVNSPTGTPTSGYAVWHQAKIVGPRTTIYVDAGGGTSGINLPNLIQEAVNDRVIDKPRYRLFGAVDLDDFPDNTMVLSDLETTYGIMQQYKIPSTWGIIADTSYINTVDQSLYDFVAAHSADKGGLIYPIDHAGNDYWDSAFSTIDANYQTSIANMLSKGIHNGSNAPEYTDSWGYRYFNTNALNDNGARVCEKYGLKAIRLSKAIKGTGVTANWIGSPQDAGSALSYHRGMLLLPSESFIASSETNLDLNSDLNKFAITVKAWIVGCLAHKHILYMHGANFYDGHSGGNAPGNVIMRAIGGLSSFMKDVVENVHPSRFYELLDRGSSFSTLGSSTSSSGIIGHGIIG